MSTLADPWMCSDPSAPRIRRFSVDEYHRMFELGILTEDDRVELLEGVVVERSRITAPHRAVVVGLNEWLLRRSSGLWHVSCQQPVTFERSEPRPDLSVVRGKNMDYWDRLPGRNDVPLLIEVADTTLASDCGLKAEIYAAAGIPEYWVVDIVGAEVHILRDPRPTGYGMHDVLPRTDTIPLMIDGMQVAALKIADFMPSARRQ